MQTQYSGSKGGQPMTSICIADGCGRQFDPSAPEPRDVRRLVAFWQRYCPKHRQATGDNNTPMCETCSQPIERDGTRLNFWRHSDTRLYQCGKGAQYGGKQAEPAKTDSDQFFDAAIRPELVKLEAEAILQDMAEAIGDGTEAELLAALAKEQAAVRVDLATLEREAREIENLERMLGDNR
jgi:hypothetical protein